MERSNARVKELADKLVISEDAALRISMPIDNNASEIACALNRIADAIQANAKATELLARATAGEFDEQEEMPEATVQGKGMGMGMG